MAIDPAISLGVIPPKIDLQIPQPIQQFGQILTLHDLMQRGQINQVALQSQMLELQQRQQAFQEQKALADYFAKSYGTSGNTAQTTAPAVPSILPTPAGGTAAQTGPAVIPPIPNAGGVVAPVQPIPNAAGSATVAPNFGMPAGAPAAPAFPASSAPFSLFGSANAGDILRIAPNTGMGVLQKMNEFQKAQSEALIKQFEAHSKQAEGLAGIAQSVVRSKDPQSAIIPAVMQAVQNGYMTQDEARTISQHPYDAGQWQGFIDKVLGEKDYHDIQKTDLQALGESQKNAAESIRSVTDQAGYDRWLALQHPAIRQMLGPTYSPQLQSHVISWGIPGAELPKTEAAERGNAAQVLGAIASRGGKDAVNAELNRTDAAGNPVYSSAVKAIYQDAATPAQVAQLAVNPDQYLTALHQNVQQQIDARKYAIDKAKFDAQYGPGTAESWAAQVYANPDTVKDIPPDQKNAVLSVFNSKYHLPLPNQLDSGSLKEESAANNTARDADWIRNALKNPQIANNLGPILGNIQNVEQRVGAATGLTGADAAVAQEFRSRMRFMIADEAKSMGARLNPKTMDDLQKSSGTITMTPEMLSGALDAVTGSAKQKLDTFEERRFGAGHMRPPEARGIGAPASVQKALANVAADGSTHQLSDGSYWRKNPDGSISAAQRPQ